MSLPSRAQFASLCAALIGFVVVPHLALAEASVPHVGEKEAEIEAALNEPTSFDFMEKPLWEVVEFFEQKLHIQIYLDLSALEVEGVGRETAITRRVHDITLKTALDMLLQDLEATYLVRDEVLVITTRFEAEGIFLTRVYPVASLLAPRDDGVLVSFRTNFGELIELITSSIKPESWDETGGLGTIKEHNKSPSLVVSQTYSVHREIAALLASLRAVGHAQPGRDEAPRAAIEDDLMQLKVYQLPRLQFVAGLPQPAAPAHPTTAAPATSAPVNSAPAAPAPPGSAPTAPGAATAPTSMESMVALQQELLLRSQRELLKMIESVTGPNTWSDNGGQGVVWIVNGTLVVRQTGDVHRQIGRLLEAISDAGPRQPVGGGMGGGGFF